MKAARTITWKTAKGNEMKAEIEVTREMETETMYADGWNLEMDNKKMVERMEIKVYLDGKFVGRTYGAPSVVTDKFYSKEFATRIRNIGGYAMLTDNVVLKEAVFNEIMEAIAEATKEAETDKEYAEAKAVEVKNEAARNEKIEEMKQVEIPEEALAAYNNYNGSSEAAWEKEDERSWALIEKWAPYIEAQRGMHPDRIKSLWDEMSREQRFGIID